MRSDARSRSSKKQFKQQRQQRQRQRRLKKKPTFIFNLRISRELRFIQLAYTRRNIPNRICKTASKFEEILKIGRRIVHVLSNMQNVAISRFFVTFCEQRQRNKLRIITHAYTAIVLVAVKFCSVELPKTEKTAKQRTGKQAQLRV